jgi:glycosyltransferase involved in cell wall biosynthesis
MHCAEALGYGLPVVATRDGAVLDYLNDANAWLVDVAGREPLYPEGTEDHCGLGATADFADALLKLRNAIAGAEEAKRRARSAVKRVRTDWSWRRATQKLIAFAAEICRQASL